MKKQNTFIIVLFVAVVLSIAAFSISSKLNSRFFDNHPNIGDQASYYYSSIHTYYDFLFNGKWEVIKKQYLYNTRNPLWTIPLLIFNPKLLAERNGQIVIGAFMLFCFLCMLGITVFKRTKSILYAIACMAAVLSAEYFFDPVNGLGGNDLDPRTAYLVGAALLALINSNEARSGKWLILFGIFTSLAHLSRFVSIGAVFVICGPIFTYYLVKRFKSERSMKSILVPLCCAVVPVSVLSGYSIWSATMIYFKMYFTGAMVESGITHLFKPLSESLPVILRIYDRHLGTSGYLVLLFFSFFYFVRFWHLRESISSLCITIWSFVSFVLLHALVLRITVEWIVLSYSLPGFYLLAFAPFTIKYQDANMHQEIRLNEKTLVLFMMVILIFSSVQGYKTVYKRHLYPDPMAQKTYVFQRDMAFVLKNLTEKYYKQPTSIDTVPSFNTYMQFGDLEIDVSISNDAAHTYKKFLRCMQYFNHYKPQWEMTYPGMSWDNIKEAVYNNVLNNLDFVVIMSNPRNDKAKEIVHDDWAIDLGEDMYRRLTKNSSYWFDETITDKGPYESPWGEIHVFRNLKRYDTHYLKK